MPLARRHHRCDAGLHGEVLERHPRPEGEHRDVQTRTAERPMGKHSPAPGVGRGGTLGHPGISPELVGERSQIGIGGDHRGTVDPVEQMRAVLGEIADARRETAGVKAHTQGVDRWFEQLGRHALGEDQHGRPVGRHQVPPAVDDDRGKRLVPREDLVDRVAHRRQSRSIGPTPAVTVTPTTITPGRSGGAYLRRHGPRVAASTGTAIQTRKGPSGEKPDRRARSRASPDS